MWQYLAVAAILWAIKEWYWSFKGLENVDKMFPGPPTVPIFGNALLFAEDAAGLYSTAMRLAKVYKRNMRIWVFNSVNVIVYNPPDIELVLNNTVHLKKNKAYDATLPWLGRGLLTTYGDRWKKDRKMLMPAFNIKILETYLSTFNVNGDVFCKILEAKVDQAGFDVAPYVRLLTLDNICETAMGVKIDAQHNPHLELFRALKSVCQAVSLRQAHPLLYFDFIFKMTKLGRENAKNVNILHTLTRSVMEQRILQRKEEKESRLHSAEENENEDEDIASGIRKKRSFLDTLLDLADEGSLTMEEVKDEVNTLLFAGHDTVTAGLSFCIYNLAHHPEYQAKAYEEQLEIFKDDSTRHCTPDDLSKMKYLEMVIKESLRLYPSTPGFGRFLEQDLRLDDCTVIPKGAEVIVAAAALHVDHEIWEKPDEFYPDHFAPDAVAKRHPYAYVPFSAGPRNCIGMKFAMLEMKCALSKIVRRFHLKPSRPQVELVLVNEVSLKSKTGINISLSTRTYDA